MYYFKILVHRESLCTKGSILVHSLRLCIKIGVNRTASKIAVRPGPPLCIIFFKMIHSGLRPMGRSFRACVSKIRPCVCF